MTFWRKTTTGKYLLVPREESPHLTESSYMGGKHDQAGVTDDADQLHL